MPIIIYKYQRVPKTRNSLIYQKVWRKNCHEKDHSYCHLILLAGISVVYASNYPQLTGTWVGSTYGHGYFPIKGTTEYHKFLDGRESMKVHYIIQEQKERLFWGIKKVFTDTGEMMFEEEFSGAFEKDSQRFYIIEHLDGTGMGQVIN